MLTEKFTQALTYAHQLHATQIRKGSAHQLHATQIRKGSGVPYISHLLGVASIALEYGANEDEAIAALLHDAIEDQGGAATREEIRRRFGDNVTAIVDGCTDADTTPKPPWKERKEKYLAHISTASPSVLLVSCADKLYNVRSILKDYRLMGDAVWERFKAGKEGTLWYYRALVDAFKKTNKNTKIIPLVEELERVIIELETLVN